MKVRELIEKLKNEDQESDVAVDGYDFDIYSSNVNIRIIPVDRGEKEYSTNYYYDAKSEKKIVVLTRLMG